MDDREQQRKIRHRLAVLRHAEEVSGNVAATYRYYGISRPTFYKRRNRFDELGPDGRTEVGRAGVGHAVVLSVWVTAVFAEPSLLAASWAKRSTVSAA